MSTDADTLRELLESSRRIEGLLAQILERVPDLQAPVNAYGETLVDGIQNAIERGQRGISTYR